MLILSNIFFDLFFFIVYLGYVLLYFMYCFILWVFWKMERLGRGEIDKKDGFFIYGKIVFNRD